MITNDLWEFDGEFTAENVENGIRLTSNDQFPTCCLRGNNYYFEIEMNSNGTTAMQIGIGDDKFVSDSDRGQGIGDDNHSWAIDLHRKKRFGIIPVPCRMPHLRCNEGDIIGCLLDYDTQQISYFKNGKPLGIGFKNVSVQELYPALSVQNMDGQNKIFEFMQKNQMHEHVHDEHCAHGMEHVHDEKCAGHDHGVQEHMHGNDDMEQTELVAREHEHTHGAGMDDYDELVQFIEGLQKNDIKSPPLVKYANIIFNLDKLKYKPKGCKAISENVAFGAEGICNKLQNYSYEQYKMDYLYSKSIIDIESLAELSDMLQNVDG